MSGKQYVRHCPYLKHSLIRQEWYLVHRVDLHNHLKQRALETATLHLQCKITNIDITSFRPSVTLDNERTFECDLLLGADGLHVCAFPTSASSNLVNSPSEVRPAKQDSPWLSHSQAGR